MADSTVLVVDDEPRILEFLEENLRADDFTVLKAVTAAEALDLLGRSRPDVVLLDVVLPDMSGHDLCRTVREGDVVRDPWDPDVPIIMLSAKAETMDRVRGLSRGADDYLTKPFAYPELLARIGAVTKRVTRASERERLRVGELTIDTASREVTVGGMQVSLSAKEFQLLAALAADPDRVFTKRELLETVWEFRSPGRTRTQMTTPAGNSLVDQGGELPRSSRAHPRAVQAEHAGHGARPAPGHHGGANQSRRSRTVQPQVGPPPAARWSGPCERSKLSARSQNLFRSEVL